MGRQGPHLHTHGVMLEYMCTADDKEECVSLEFELDKVMLDAANAWIESRKPKEN